MPSRKQKQASNGAAPEQDTPGRAKSHSSRQQTHPGQGADTGSEELDSQPVEAPRLKRDSERLKSR